MSFLSPWSALLVAAIAIPALLLLYLLKLRRQPLRIPSTLLWRQAFEDLQANVPFQRLRYTPLLLIQLLLLVALILAFAQPVIEGAAQPSSRMILLIDVSASMQATDADPNDPQQTRFDAAIDRAREMISSAARADRAVQFMIVSVGRSPRVITSFESNRAILLDALDRITPTDESADLAQALRLADAFASRAEQDEQPPEVVLLSDGGVDRSESSSGFDLSAGRFRYIRVGPPLGASIDNVGITAFTARRNYEDPASVEVFARLTNAGDAEIEIAVTLRSDAGEVLPLMITVPSATPAGPGERSFSATMDIPGRAVLTLTHNHNDALPADNAAALVLPAPQQPRIAVVHPDTDDDADPFIVDLLRAADPQSLIVMTGSQYEARAADPQQINQQFDLILFDRVSPLQFPDAPTLSFGAVPPTLKTNESSSTGGQSILSWQRQHPLMQYVDLDAVRFAGFGGYELPPGATPLAWGADGPVIALLRRGNVEHVAVGFELRRSDWPLHISFAVFVQNVLERLVTGDGAAQANAYQAGEAISIMPAPNADRIIVTGPFETTVPVNNVGPVTISGLPLAGLYELTGAQPPNDVLAVNVLSVQESDTRPAGAVRVNAELAEASSASDSMARPLWPWLVAVAVALAVLEWLLWCARARS